MTYAQSAYAETHYHPNLQIDQVVEAMLEEKKRMQSVELKAYWILCAFLALMNIGALRFIFSMIGT